jgi:hypothetical protein
MAQVLRIFYFLTATALVLHADGGTIEGIVLNSVTGEGVSGVTVEITTTNAKTLTLRTRTGPSGEFRFSGLDPGEFSVSYRKDGFDSLEDEAATNTVRVSGQGLVRLRKELDPLTVITGRVLDGDDNGLKRIRVELLSGRGHARRTVSTDAAGAFRIGNLHPGIYLLRATPDRPGWETVGKFDDLTAAAAAASLERRPLLAPSYFPGVSSLTDASPVRVNGEPELDGYNIRIPSPNTVAIRGRVVDPQGDPVANVTVKLKSADTHYSFDGDPSDAQVSSGDQGSFEFSMVSPGHWHLLAETGNLMAFAPVLLGQTGQDDVVLRLERPFALDVTMDGPPDRLILLPVDGPLQQEVTTRPSKGGKLRVDVYPGRYRFDESSPAGYYIDSILLGERNVLGRDVELMEGVPPIRIVYKQDGAKVRGTVNGGAGATVVLVPELSSPDYWRSAKCDEQGRFEIRDLRPGYYFTLAVRRPSALQDAGFVGLVERQGTRLRVDSSQVVTEDLQLTSWPR